MLQNNFFPTMPFNYSPLSFLKEGEVVSVFLGEAQLCRVPLFTVIPTVSRAMRPRERERERKQVRDREKERVHKAVSSGSGRENKG